MTTMTTEHHTMLTYWTGLTPGISTTELAANLQRRFSMKPGEALILACRFKNELHTRAAIA